MLTSLMKVPSLKLIVPLPYSRHFNTPVSSQRYHKQSLTLTQELCYNLKNLVSVHNRIKLPDQTHPPPPPLCPSLYQRTPHQIPAFQAVAAPQSSQWQSRCCAEQAHWEFAR
jgi:hypothetical protein